jgi:hypothetical protein
VKAALIKEIGKIFDRATNHDGNHFRGTLRVAAKKRKPTREAANPIIPEETVTTE